MAIITNNIEWSQSSSLRINTSNENNNQGGEEQQNQNTNNNISKNCKNNKYKRQNNNKKQQEQEEETHHDKLAEDLFMTHLSVILSRRTKGGNEEKKRTINKKRQTNERWSNRDKIIIRTIQNLKWEALETTYRDMPSRNLLEPICKPKHNNFIRRVSLN